MNYVHVEVVKSLNDVAEDSFSIYKYALIDIICKYGSIRRSVL